MIKTRDFGELPAEKASLITFKKPLFGFEDLTKYYLIPLEEPEAFTLLQSAEDIEASFLITQPRLFISDYLLDVNDEDVALLGAVEHMDLLDFAILTVPERVEDITMNILGPVIINSKNNSAIQTISNVAHYGTKCRLFLPAHQAVR